MTPQQRTDVYQRRDALLASLNYATDDEEASDMKRQIEDLNQQLANDVAGSQDNIQLKNDTTMPGLV